MVNGTGSGGELQVSRCSCETGRDRYHVSKNASIPFEHLALLLDDDDASEDDEDEAFAEAEMMDELGIELMNVNQESDAGSEDDDEHVNEAPLFGAGEDATSGLVHSLDIEDDDADGSEAEDEQEGVGSESNTDDEDFPEGHHRVPTIARWRLNLTALSQYHNLYFVAFRNQIHISRPRSCISHRLPSTPDLILSPEASKMGLLVGGFIDVNFPHQVNHLIIGDFGEEEILLLAYDDGDVIGYYTRHIENEVIRREQLSSTGSHIIQPFFHENVEKSAWGLAVHKRSRIIAAGSNTHAVTVFIPALTGCPYRHLRGERTADLYRTIVKDDKGVPVTIEGVDLNMAENSVDDMIRCRDANWKMVLETGLLGDNIPNLTFSNDESGNVDKVVAVDVSGNIWLMDIWTTHKAHRVIPGLHRSRTTSVPGDTGKPRGWGVLVLHESSFLPTKNFKDSLGLLEQDSRPARNAVVGQWIDISRGIKEVPRNSTQHPYARARHSERALWHEHRRLVEYDYWFEDYNDGQSSRWPWASSMPRMLSSPPKEIRNGPEEPEDGATIRRGLFNPQMVLGDGSSIIRTYETDIELRSHEEGGVGIMFQHATRQVYTAQGRLPAVRWAQERLHSNHHVPELSLVVAASMCGRVALLTLTRPEKQNLGFKRGFKVEAILPTKKEEDNGLRPICPLFGVAVGPLPLARRSNKGDRPSPRRFRLMLQYYDLRVLSYEISRHPEADDLTII
ncbi:hypothetical protein BJ170DRAFT_677408 [Xylariales sp. AK1849]|nr:hypothetical protein BJ170DRAFT_677408 [Xylariales sp. AK1849]